MCHLCFDTLLKRLTPPEIISDLWSSNDGEAALPEQPQHLASIPSPPLFVTWEIRDTRRNPPKSLRGCIGTLATPSGDRSLEAVLLDYAWTSAVRDERFDPIRTAEIPDLICTVSLLVEFEMCKDIEDWEVGVHGLVIRFPPPGSQMNGGKSSYCYSATFLPNVASDQGWTIRETLAQLICKSGYNGPITPELLDSIRCQRYQASKCTANFAEYCTARHSHQSGSGNHQHTPEKVAATLRASAAKHSQPTTAPSPNCRIM